MRLPKELEAAILARADRIDGKPVPGAHSALETISERQFQSAVIKEAKKQGWLVFHPWLSVKSAAGWPDLSMCRSGRLILAELKTMIGEPTAAQLTWGELLRSVSGVEYHLWRPNHWPQIVEELA